MCDCCEQLEQRIAKLEQRVNFSSYIRSLGPDIPAKDVVREWFKYHNVMNPRELEIETASLYSAQTYRMSAHRMVLRGELVRAPRLGLFMAVGRLRASHT